MCSPWLYSHTIVSVHPPNRHEFVYLHLEYIDIRRINVVYLLDDSRPDFVGYYNRRLGAAYESEAELFRSIDASYRPVISSHIMIASRRQNIIT